MRSRKRPCQPKTAKRIFGGPGSQGPSGQAKERMRVLPARRDLLCLACRAVCRGGRSCTACRCYVGFRAWCPGGFFRRCAAALSPACGLSDASALGLVCAAAACLPCACARVFSSVFCLFPPDFCLSNLFSFVAQAATGIFSLVPSRGFVPGLHVLPPAAFSQTFAPIACLPVLRCLCELSLVFLPFPA